LGAHTTLSGTRAYRGELGLELELQVLERAPQIRDLVLAGLELLGVGADLFPELPTLQ
jgi:hypothetical protein